MDPRWNPLHRPEDDLNYPVYTSVSKILLHFHYISTHRDEAINLFTFLGSMCGVQLIVIIRKATFQFQTPKTNMNPNIGYIPVETTKKAR